MSHGSIYITFGKGKIMGMKNKPVVPRIEGKGWLD